MSTESSSPGILVVDDTVESLRLLTGILSARGYSVRPATSGAFALQAAALSPPDLILLDINMPEMNGLEVCARLKANEATREIPVIFLTALSDPADKVAAFEAGGVDYITKPFHADEVEARVKTHIALRRAQVEVSTAYERLRGLERLRDDLVHMVVHDMRSRVAVTLSYLDLLAEDARPLLSPGSLADLAAATGAAETLRHMMNELLDISRLEDGKMPIEPSDCDLTALARGITEGLSAGQSARSVTLLTADPITTACDASLIRRVLENLVTNALKHTPPGTAVRIALSAMPDSIRITVDDSGPGVPEDARTRIFEKFQTAAAWKDGTHHSAGLGLAFCKLAVEAHGGTIGVDGLTPQGSSFWVQLPRAAAA